MLESPEDLIPQVAAGKFTAKVIFTLIVGAVVLIAGLYVIWKVFFAERAAQAKHDQVQTQANIGTAKAGQESAQAAIRITVDNAKGAAAVDAAVREAINAISQAKGADVRLDPDLDGLGRRSICLRASAASLPDCQHLLGNGPGRVGE